MEIFAYKYLISKIEVAVYLINTRLKVTYETTGSIRKFRRSYTISRLHVACLHDQNKSGFLGGLAFIHPIGAI